MLLQLPLWLSVVDLKSAPMCRSATSLQSGSNIFACMRQNYVLMHQLAMEFRVNLRYISCFLNTAYTYFYIYKAMCLKQASTRGLYIYKKYWWEILIRERVNSWSEIKANIVYKPCHYQSLQYELKWNLKKQEFAVFHHQHFYFETKGYIYIFKQAVLFLPWKRQVE